MLLCTCLALNPLVTRHAKLKLIPLSCKYVIILYFSVSSMSTLRCYHHMNLSCDAVTVLMVITCVLIYLYNYVAIYRIRTQNYYNPVHVSFMQYLVPFIKMYCINMQWCGLCS